MSAACNKEFVLTSTTNIHRGMRWCILLRHCTISRKVAGLIPSGVTGIFRWHNLSGHTTVLEGP